MSKMRVYEYAKKQSTSSKDVIEKLKSINVNVTNHMSSIDGETIGKLDSMFKGTGQNDQLSKQRQGKESGERPKGQTNTRQGQKNSRNQKQQGKTRQVSKKGLIKGNDEIAAEIKIDRNNSNDKSHNNINRIRQNQKNYQK